MNVRAAVAVGSSLLFLAACAGDAPSVDSVSAAATVPVDSASALPPGGGCHPVGLTATGIDLFPLINPEWAPVVNGASPFSAPVLLHGTVVESQVSREDFPSTHVTHDQNASILLDEDDRGLLATGNVAKEDGTLELEWETGSYPPWAWAGPGDRIVALGRWIFDCGHPDPTPGTCHGTIIPCVLDSDCGGVTCDGTVFNYRSEMHPPQASAVVRSSKGAILTAQDDSGEPGPAVLVTRADVYVSGHGGGAGDVCVVTAKDSFEALLGAPCFPLTDSDALALLPPGAGPLNAVDFEFDVPLPEPRGSEVVVRVVPRDTPTAFGAAVPARLEVSDLLDLPSPHVHVTVHMTEPVGGQLPTGFAGTILAGWSGGPRGALAHLRITLDAVSISDPLKPVPLAQVLAAPDGWVMEAAVNGDWQIIGGLDAITAQDEGATVPVHAVFDEYVPRDGTLNLVASAASLTCNDRLFGRTLLDDLIGFGGNFQLAFACLSDRKQLDAGTVAVSFTGPRFGAQPEPYVLASQGGAAAYSMSFRIERVED